MKTPDTTLLLRTARERGYALAAFNAVNLETAQTIVGAAEAERAPVILQISENAARYGDLNCLFALSEVLRAAASVPVILHFDHAETLESALRAVELGFDSVMLESADLAPEANVQELKRLSDAAHGRGVAVEGEFEIASKEGRVGEMLAPERLSKLAAASGCDMIAINIGSAHKMTEKSARLDLQKLEAIAALVPQPLVLHGSSGVSEAELSGAVERGIAKVNVATELMGVFSNSVRESLEDGQLQQCEGKFRGRPTARPTHLSGQGAKRFSSAGAETHPTFREHRQGLMTRRRFEFGADPTTVISPYDGPPPSRRRTWLTWKRFEPSPTPAHRSTTSTTSVEPHLSRRLCWAPGRTSTFSTAAAKRR